MVKVGTLVRVSSDHFGEPRRPPRRSKMAPIKTPAIEIITTGPNGPCRTDAGSERRNQAGIPSVFVDVMAIRAAVGGEGAGIACEYSPQDQRSVHFVYPSPPMTKFALWPTPLSLSLDKARYPIAATRLVPYPHAPHPRKGGHYHNGQLTNVGATVFNIAVSWDEWRAMKAEEKHRHIKAPPKFVKGLTAAEQRQTAYPWDADNNDFVDRATSHHDSQER
ncbi:hypothetical protein B0T25DRAFT_302670 [Lasiosphaeria hispida]|uniref:Uncharacterized protein n=1 Tax=Lasiosphaeria hispida TaxID=260671 RepID=A0AAJ0H880_9PEZI|nr:hypothetical protein B0T25DRAFT_302670 [Lasiosphaeria hispida]